MQVTGMHVGGERFALRQEGPAVAIELPGNKGRASVEFVGDSIVVRLRNEAGDVDLQLDLDR